MECVGLGHSTPIIIIIIIIITIIIITIIICITIIIITTTNIIIIIITTIKTAVGCEPRARVLTSHVMQGLHVWEQ